MRFFRSPFRWLLVCTTLLVAAEAVLVYFDTLLGATMHAMLVGVLLLQFALSHHEDEQMLDGHPRDRSVSHLILPVFAQISLLRFISVSLPIEQIPEEYWYAMIGIPVILGSIMTARLVGLTRREIGILQPLTLSHIAVAISGIPLGFIGYIFIRPSAVFTINSWFSLFAGALLLAIFAGFLEEFLFRGILQSVANRMVGSHGILLSSLVYSITYLGSYSLSYAVFMSIAGLIFAICYFYTSSLWSVVIAHSLLSIAMLVIFPTVLQR